MSGRKLRVIVVDDEPLARRGLILRLAALGTVEVVAECGNGSDALTAIAETAPDVAFLDIQMPGMDGLDVVRRIPANVTPLIVFVTAFDRFAVDAFELHAVDYLLKPVESERLEATLARAAAALEERSAADDKARLLGLMGSLTGRSEAGVLDMLESSGELPRRYAERLTIRDGSEVTLVPMDRIEWVDAAGDYMCVHAEGQTHVMRSTMKALETQLDPQRFVRIHRSAIVNVARVTKVGGHINGEYFLTLDCGARLKMSRTYRDRIDRIIAGTG